MSAGDLCPPRDWDGTPLTCGRIVLERDPTSREEACPSYGGGGLQVCWDCAEIVAEFMKRAYDARARRQEWEEDHGFEPLP